MSDRELAPGDVISEIDERGRFVELWVVISIGKVFGADKIEPISVRRAMGNKPENWGNRHWRFSDLNHKFKIPEGM